MTDFEIKRSLIEDKFTTSCLVTFLKLICNRIEIGKQTMVIKNESENN